MRYWLDTEFIEDGKTIELLSIGIVAADRREFYRQNSLADHARASAWVQVNVLPHLAACPVDAPKDAIFHTSEHLYPCRSSCPWQPPAHIARDLRGFCNPEVHGKPEFWGYYADYDWVVVCQLFGTMMELPKGWPMYCRDLKQWCDDLGNPELPKQGAGEHHALADARWNKQAWEFLKRRERING